MLYGWTRQEMTLQLSGELIVLYALTRMVDPEGFF